jgi:single-strand DNA-binding protein
MKTLARVILLGIVGKDPEIKPTKSGLVIATFPVATMVKKKDPNGAYFESTLWHNLVSFCKLAENIEKTVRKGSKIYVDGTIDYQEYQDSNGSQKLSTKIIINDFSVISKSEYQQSRDSLESLGNKRKTDFDKPFFETDDDIPF